MTDKEIEAGIERACECDCAPPSTGWTVNPFPIIRDYIERLKHRAEVAERNDKIKDRALNDACYALARIYNPNDSKVVVGKGFRENYIQQAEREVEEEKND